MFHLDQIYGGRADVLPAGEIRDKASLHLMVAGAAESVGVWNAMLATSALGIPDTMKARGVEDPGYRGC